MMTERSASTAWQRNLALTSGERVWTFEGQPDRLAEDLEALTGGEFEEVLSDITGGREYRKVAR